MNPNSTFCAALVAFTLCLTLHANSPTWRSELYANDWQPPGPETNFYTDKILQDYSYAGYKLGQEPLPSIEGSPDGGRFFNVTQSPFQADPTGRTDSTAAIQGAIDAAGQAGGGVVYMPPGNYRLSTNTSGVGLTIRHPNIVLRGAGIDQTFLLNTTTNRPRQRIIEVVGPGADWNTSNIRPVAITRDLMGPTHVIPVEDTTSFLIGDWIVVRMTATPAWTDEHREPGWRDHVGRGSLSGLAYYRQIVAIDQEAGALVIDIPTRYAIKTRDRAQVDFAGPQVTEVGLENFSIGNLEHPEGKNPAQWSPNSFNNPNHHAAQVHQSAALSISHTRDSWVRNVHSFQTPANPLGSHLLSHGVVIRSSRSLTLENVAMQRPLYGGGGSNGYMFRISGSSDILLSNCLASHSRHGFVFTNMTASGNVIHNSKDRRTNWQAAGNNHAGGSNSDHHMFFSHSNLIDHSRVRESMFEARYRPFGGPPRHNITGAHTTFWNTMGLGGGENAVHTEQARYGYAIGTQGLHGSSRVGVVVGDGNRPQTLPLDHVEGIGQGASLRPASLYLDQLARRQQSIQLVLIQAADALPPRSTGRVSVHAAVGNQLDVSESELTYHWAILSGPGIATFSHPDQSSSEVKMDQPGVYRIEVTATAGNHQAKLRTSVAYSPYP